MLWRAKLKSENNEQTVENSNENGQTVQVAKGVTLNININVNK